MIALLSRGDTFLWWSNKRGVCGRQCQMAFAEVRRRMIVCGIVDVSRLASQRSGIACRQCKMFSSKETKLESQGLTATRFLGPRYLLSPNGYGLKSIILFLCWCSVFLKPPALDILSNDLLRLTRFDLHHSEVCPFRKRTELKGKLLNHFSVHCAKMFCGFIARFLREHAYCRAASMTQQ